LVSILKINNPERKSKKILVAPLDWGLGHATRCIPIIKELIIQKYEVCIAASGDQKRLLKAEFPGLSYVELPGYHIKYDKNRALTLLRLVGSIPKILIRVKEENRWLRQYKATGGVDIIISDNRYGLWDPDLCCILITHQLTIQSGLGGRIDRWIQRLHYRLIHRFNTCWVPDMPDRPGLAGRLSHPERMPDVPTHYIGLLSRMEKMERKDEPIDLLILLSGPEPQRSILEKMLWKQLPSFKGSVVFVRGLPCGGQNRLEGEQAAVYEHLPARELNECLSRARLVVARTGYSTVMDLVRLKKKAVLIPTPGQTEQEYLGIHLTSQRIALCVNQNGFSLKAALTQAEQFPYITLQEKEGLLQDVIAQSFSSIRLG